MLVLSIVMLLPSSVVAQSAADEAAIRSIVAEQAAAWNAGSGARYAGRVAEDVSFTNLFGMVMYGKAPFVARHKEILATFYKGTTKHHAIRKIRFVTPDVAIVDIDNEVHGVKAMPAGIVGSARRRDQDAADGSVRSPWWRMVDRGVSQRRHQAAQSKATGDLHVEEIIRGGVGACCDDGRVRAAAGVQRTACKPWNCRLPAVRP